MIKVRKTRNSARLLIVFTVILSVGSINLLRAEEEKLTITAYHPSPSGSYNEITTTGNTYLAVTSGDVGIGTSAPLELLQAGTGPTPGLVVAAAGNVGIGTTASGSYKLYIAGDLYVTGNITGGGGTKINPRETSTPPPLAPRVNRDLNVVRYVSGPFGSCVLHVQNGVIKSSNCVYHSDP